MDRTMVHTEGQIEDTDLPTVTIVHDVPFNTVPRFLLEQLGVSPDTFARCADAMDACVFCWNIAIVLDSYVIGIAWGIYEPFDDSVIISRVAIAPELYTYKGKWLDVFIRAGRARFVDRRIFMMTTKRQKRWSWRLLRCRILLPRMYWICRLIPCMD